MLLLDTPTLETLPPNPVAGTDAPFRTLPHVLTFDEAESRYLSAKNRLVAAQDEKADAISEFMQARDVLRAYLEELWPDRDAADAG